MDYSEDDYSAKAEEADRLAAEKEAMDDAWKELVTSVLSHTMIDPKHKGQAVEYYQQYEDEVTDDQVAALQRSPYGKSFQHVVDLWKKNPAEKRPDLYEVTDVFKNLATATDSPGREISSWEEYQSESNKPPFTQLEILTKVQHLTHSFGKQGTQFPLITVSEKLNDYLYLGLRWPHIEAMLLRLCIHRAENLIRQNEKGLGEVLADKWDWLGYTWFGILVQGLMKLMGFAVPRLIGLAIRVVINVAIVILSLEHLSGNYAIFAILGLIFVGFNVIGMAIRRGTYELRASLRKILHPPYPGWYGFEFDEPMPLDLWALNKVTNRYRGGHINLRLVRDQLIRLQNTDIDLPVQFITLLDRAIADGEHYW